MEKYELSKTARQYKPKPIEDQYLDNIVVDMVLNNMKIEGQPVPLDKYLLFRKEMKKKEFFSQ